MIVARPATKADAEWVGANLRPEDAQEVTTSTGGMPLVQAVVESFLHSQRVHVICEEDEKPCAIFGVCHTTMRGQDGPVGGAWFLATPEVTKHARSILRQAPEWLDRLSEDYPGGLANFADRRNRLHLRWVRAAGFVWDEYGPSIMLNGHRFIYIWRPQKTHV